MKKFSADYIFPVSSPPIENGVVEINDEGVIVALRQSNITDKNIEKHKGIIVPGFVNAHCHLELSHLKDKIVCQNGLKDFLPQISKYRDSYTEAEQIALMRDADHRMQAEGIVAVGDISNTSLSFETKKHSAISYHTFVELYALDSSQNDEKLAVAERNADELKRMKLPYSIVPHATYSVNKMLLEAIISKQKDNTICCIHNQETVSENQLFIEGSGVLHDMFTSLGFDMSEFSVAGKSALMSIKSYLNTSNPFMFVHNTYTSREEVLDILSNFNASYWTLCPASNIFIEQQLPDARMFNNSGAKVALGTDSLASNKKLSILSEMKLLSENFAAITFGSLLKWATLNGAEALQMDKTLGSIEKGKAPGLVLIDNIDSENNYLTAKSKASLLHTANKHLNCN